MGMILHLDRWWNDLMMLAWMGQGEDEIKEEYTHQGVVILVLGMKEQRQDPCSGKAEGVLLDFLEEEAGILKD